MSQNLTGRLWSLLLCGFIALSSLALSPVQAFAVDPTFTFNGGGWGHGIGLSQYGAQGYALKGWKYDAIIKHYYQGTKIVTKPSVTVRVNIEDGGASRTQWQIRAGSDTTLTVAQESDTSIRQVLTKTKSYWITASNGNTQVRADSSGAPGAVIRSFSGACYATAGGLVQMAGTSGPFNHTGVRWRGTIHFQPPTATSSTTRAVNYVDIEQYLYGVVPRESPSSWHAEALKAQALAARSYAYQDGLERRTIYCTTRSQVYNGQSRPGYAHEAASTNAAVNATKGKLVWYGSETQPVKTYFSSSSGGHTASIEDVWTSSAPKPYYTGVPDADQANPYYTWTNGAYSAQTAAERIRNLDIARGGGLEYSAAAPAVVTAISTERASSGYTHHATVTWSNGDRFRITGTTIQSAFGLRSSKFGVTRKYPVVKKTRYQESDTRLSWYGHWRRLSSSQLSGGSMRYSYTTGSALTAAFSGNGIVWVGKKGPSHGKADVYIDGKLIKTVDLYSASNAYGQTLFSSTSLTSGAHTLVIKTLGQRRAAATGSAVTIDALDVINGSLSQATTSLRRYEQNQERLAPLGSWTTISTSAYSNGSTLRSNATDAEFYCTFYGSEVRWIGARAAGYGRARVSIDGGSPTEVVLTSATTAYQQALFTKTGMSQDKAHTMRIQVLGVGSGGTDGFAAVDAIEIRGGWLLPAVLPSTTADQTHSSVKWSPGWTTSTGSGFVGGSHRWSASPSAVTTVTFEGTSVTWIGRKSPAYGKATLYIDGLYKGAVDLYRSPAAYQQTVWTSGWLPCARHTLVIKVLGSHSSASSGNAVSVDAFRVSGRMR